MRIELKLGLTLALTALLLTSCAKSPADRAQTWEKTANSRQVEGILKLYADNVVLEKSGSHFFRGKPELREITKYDSVVNRQLTLSEVTLQGDTLLFNMVENSDWYRGLGLEKVQLRGKLVFSGGLITYLSEEIAPESHQAMHQAFISVAQWALHERPEQWAELVPQGNFIYSAETAARWLNLLRDWQKK